MAYLVKTAFSTGHKSFAKDEVTDFPFAADKAAELVAQGFIGDAPEPEPEPEAGADEPAEPQEAGEGAEAPAPRAARRKAEQNTGEADAAA